MIYLLAKYTLLFLLASVLGFVLGYWWSRRSFVDVSESYEDLRKAAERTDDANWDKLWKRFDALPEPKETDLSTVFERLDSLNSRVAGIPQPDPVNFAPVEDRLNALADRIASIPAPEKPRDPDLTPVLHRIEKLEREVHAIPAPTDLGPTTQTLRNLETAVRSIPRPPTPQTIDLAPMRNELSSISEQIKHLPKVETHEPVNLAPVVERIAALEQRVGGIGQPEKVDLQPLDARLKTIEAELGKLGERLTRPIAEPARPRQTDDEPRILSAAIYGKKDDLKRISGVGPKLESLLNENGVYYFWQVASWSGRDIEIIDKRLDAFKGRISRDNWVAQAKTLSRSPDAAEMPN